MKSIPVFQYNHDNIYSLLVYSIYVYTFCFEGEKVQATHGLVFMLGGILCRWKQVVGYELTPAGYDGAHLKPLIENIIKAAENIGLRVHSVITDMGGINQAMWRSFSNIGVHRYSVIHNSIPHPVDCNRKLFFFADGPHLLKNLRAAIINNKLIALPQTFTKTRQLSSHIVTVSHLEELVKEQENLDLKLAPKLNKDSITVTRFNKMRVNKATHIFSNDVSGALHLLSEEQNNTEYSTTATFIDIVSKWFNLITSRHAVLALGNKSTDGKNTETYKTTVEFFESCIELFRDMRVGNKGVFKPVQTGLMITTKSFIELADFLIKERGFLYVLGARFSNDFVENLFSNVRKKFPIPNALQFQYSLKHITFSQYLQALPNTNYAVDSGDLLADFLQRPKKVFSKQTEEMCVAPNVESKIIQLNNLELNSLYYVCGYIISSICKNQKICDRCIASAGSKTYDPKIQFSRLVSLKCYRAKTLFFVNNTTFNYFLDMNNVITSYLPHVKQIQYSNFNIVTFFLDKMKHIQCMSLETCHNLQYKIKIRFIKFKLRKSCYTSKIKTPIYDSKTMAMYASIK